MGTCAYSTWRAGLSWTLSKDEARGVGAPGFVASGVWVVAWVVGGWGGVSGGSWEGCLVGVQGSDLHGWLALGG